jgi:hypothetical protein
MYIQIDPKFIIANFEKPIDFSRLFRILQYENAKRRRSKQLLHCAG